MAFADLSASQRQDLAVSLSALVLSDAGADMSADNLSSVLKAANVEVAAHFPTLFAAYLEKAGGKVDKFLGAPGGGGGGASAAPAGGAAAAAPAEEKKEAKKVEEEEVDLGAGNMFGGGGDGY